MDGIRTPPGRRHVRVAIVEDSTADAEALLETLPHALPEGAPRPQARVFKDASSFILAFSPGSFDLVILDCALGEEVTGVDVARAVRSLDKDVPLVFVTSSADYAVDGYEVGAVGYVLKPVDASRLAAALVRALPEPKPEPPVYLGEGARRTPFLPSDVVWVRSDAHYIEVRLRQGKTVKIRGSLADAAEELSPLAQFFSPLRGHIINFAHVEECSGTEFLMSDGTRIPVSRSNRSAAREAYASYMFQALREGLA